METDFFTDLERTLWNDNQALKKDRDRLLRKVDSLEQEKGRLSEIVRGREIRALISLPPPDAL